MIASIKQNKKRPFIVGIAGGSGSGKTYFAEKLREVLPKEHVTLIYQDDFYIDQSHRFDHDGGSVNFDHPESLDFKRLASVLQDLINLKKTEIPLYDFVTHTRLPKVKIAEPTAIIIVDGILIFHPEEVYNKMDLRIYVDTDEAIRFERRLDRDVKERGRTPDGVVAQFKAQVKPMHDRFVEPSKTHAHHVVRNDLDFNRVFQSTKDKCLKQIASFLQS